MTESSEMENVSNDTGPFAEPVNLYLRLFAVELTGVLCILLNALNIAVLRKAPGCFGETTTLLFSALAYVDLTTGLYITIFESFYTLSSIPSTNYTFCIVAFPMVLFLGMLSAMLLGCLSIDKLVAIVKPLRYPMIMTKLKVKIIITVVLFICLLNVMGVLWIVITADSEDIMYFHTGALYCRMRMDVAGSGIALLQSFSFICLFLPLITVTYVNLRLVIIVCQHSRRQSVVPSTSSRGLCTKSISISNSPRGSPENSRPSSPPASPKMSFVERFTRRLSSTRNSIAMTNIPQLRSKRESTVSCNTQRKSHYKGLRTILVMVVIYYIAWMPLLVDTVYNIIVKKPTEDVTEFLIYLSAYSNSWWNALVYLIMNAMYRRAAKKIIRNCFECFMTRFTPSRSYRKTNTHELSL